MKKMISFEIEYTKETWQIADFDYDFGFRSEEYNTFEEVMNCMQSEYCSELFKKEILNNLRSIINGNGFVEEMYKLDGEDIRLIHVYYK